LPKVWELYEISSLGKCLALTFPISEFAFLKKHYRIEGLHTGQNDAPLGVFLYDISKQVYGEVTTWSSQLSHIKDSQLSQNSTSVKWRTVQQPRSTTLEFLKQCLNGQISSLHQVSTYTNNVRRNCKYFVMRCMYEAPGTCCRHRSLSSWSWTCQGHVAKHSLIYRTKRFIFDKNQYKQW